MCKLMMLSGITNTPRAIEFMKRMAKPMSKFNDDGIGYTAVKPNGDIFSQRWHNNDKFMDTESVMTEEIAAELAHYKKRLPKSAFDVNYTQYGEIDMSDIRTLTLHTRYATCGKEMANTHPFIYNDTSLVHNGVIRNALSLGLNKISTCDSEAALQTYLETGVINDYEKTQEWINKMSGYWAFGILGRNESGNRIFDVVRGTSNLYYTQVEGLGHVFATDKDDINSVLKDMGLKPDKEPGYLPQHTLYRFDALTGELLQEVKHKDSKKNTTSTDVIGKDGTTYGKFGYWKDGVYTAYGNRSASKYSTDRTTFGELESEMEEIKNDVNYGPSEDDDTEFPDLFNKNTGRFELSKVSKYLNDSNEPIIDRLDIYDIVYNKDLVYEYECLSDLEQAAVEDVDYTKGFKEAREMIIKLAATGSSYYTKS